jgi:ABC-type uncharacterized transport system auxiliary subunit
LRQLFVTLFCLLGHCKPVPTSRGRRRRRLHGAGGVDSDSLLGGAFKRRTGCGQAESIGSGPYHKTDQAIFSTLDVKENRMLKIKGQVFLSVNFLVFLWACGGPYYFDLQTAIPENQGGLKIDKVLSVEDVEINETYRDYRIVYRDSPFQVKYYNFVSWSKTPDELIEDAVIDFWKKRSVFKKVSTYGSADDSDWTMRIRINAIEKCYFQKNWYVRLALDAEIVDAKNNGIMLIHSFDRKMRLAGKKIRYVPEIVSKILHEELLKIEAKLQKIK